LFNFFFLFTSWNWKFQGVTESGTVATKFLPPFETSTPIFFERTTQDSVCFIDIEEKNISLQLWKAIGRKHKRNVDTYPTTANFSPTFILQNCKKNIIWTFFYNKACLDWQIVTTHLSYWSIHPSYQVIFSLYSPNRATFHSFILKSNIPAHYSCAQTFQCP
jgi:hypothetical protein